MIEAPKPYNEYKQSGLPWLDSLAPGWRILRGKGVFSAIDIRSETGKEELLTVSANDGVRPRRLKSVTMFMAKSYVGHKLCWPGDLVVNSLWAWMQGLGTAQHHGLISSAYSVYRPRKEYAAYGRFFHYLLRSSAYKWELQTRSKGVWISRLQLLDLAFMDMPILLPSPDEQVAIVRFLDHANARIDRFIRAKKKIIALLNEQKQAIIHRAVTRGLDPNVPLKPSGIPWLGDIPRHWDMLPGLVGLKEKHEKNRGMIEKRVLSLSYGRIVIKSEDKLRGLVPESFETYQIVEPGDIIIRPTDLQNDHTSLRVGLVNDRGIITSAYLCLKSLPVLVKEFAYQLLNTYDFLKIFYGLGSGTRQNLGFSDFKRLPLLFPPRDEQTKIVTYVEHENARFLPTIFRTEQEIDLIREYQTRLISDVVTGKVDVREAAKNLPAITDEKNKPAPDDDIEEELEPALSEENHE